MQVLDAAPAPASGASALPAGLMAPYLSADDGLLSRLTRIGIQATRAELERLTRLGLLREGQDWCCDGALEHRIRSSRPPALPEADAGGSRVATAQELAAASLPADAAAVWHPRAGWVQPGALVRAWLSEPGITFRGGARIERLLRTTDDSQHRGHACAQDQAANLGAPWQALNEEGQILGEAPVVVIAAALGSGPLLDGRLRLQPVRGQVSWGLRAGREPLPPFPVNGSGHLLPAVPMPEGLAWLSGSSYGHGETSIEVRTDDHAANLDRLCALLPTAGQVLAAAFTDGSVRAWTGVRCASTDRRPLVGPADPARPGLWALTALGSRGLTLSALCGQLLAAQVAGEKPPLPAELAEALDLGRQRNSANPAYPPESARRPGSRTNPGEYAYPDKARRKK